MNTTRIIRIDKFIDGSGADVRKDVFLTIKDTRIAAIDSTASFCRQEKAPVEQFPHCVIVPALVDCSVLLSQSPSVDMNTRRTLEGAGPAGKAAMWERHLRYCHGYGVLGLATSDDDPADQATALHGEEEKSAILTIRTSGGLHRSEPGHTASGVGADFIKIGYTPSIEEEETGQSQLGPADLCQVIQHRGHRKTVVVANGQRQVNEALAAGCDAIEQGYGMGTENLKRMADQGVMWIPNVLRAKNALDGAGSGGDVCCRFSQRYVAPGKPVPGAEAYWKKVLDEQLDLLRLAQGLGVKTAVGTGAGNIGILHGEAVLEEMKLFLKAGHSLTETFRSASDNGAKFFGMDNLGALQIGRNATFLIARGTVQQLPRKISFLEGIFIDGAPCPIYRKTPIKAV